MSATDLGKRLLAEPAEMGMDEVLQSLRVLHDHRGIENQNLSPGSRYPLRSV